MSMRRGGVAVSHEMLYPDNSKESAAQQLTAVMRKNKMRSLMRKEALFAEEYNEEEERLELQKLLELLQEKRPENQKRRVINVEQKWPDSLRAVMSNPRMHWTANFDLRALCPDCGGWKTTNLPAVPFVVCERCDMLRRRRILLEIALSLSPLQFTPYIVLWITDWLPEMQVAWKDTNLGDFEQRDLFTEYERVKLLEGVQRSVRSL
jgi:hypothetical protein